MNMQAATKNARPTVDIVSQSAFDFVELMIMVADAIRANGSAMNDGGYGPEPMGGFEGKESVITRTQFAMGRLASSIG